MKQQKLPSEMEKSAVKYTMQPPPPDRRTPEQKLRGKLEMGEINKKMKDLFKNGVDLSGKETP